MIFGTLKNFSIGFPTVSASRPPFLVAGTLGFFLYTVDDVSASTASTEDVIPSLEIPTGIPLVYQLDDDLKPSQDFPPSLKGEEICLHPLARCMLPAHCQVHWRPRGGEGRPRKGQEPDQGLSGDWIVLATTTTVTRNDCLLSMCFCHPQFSGIF